MTARAGRREYFGLAVLALPALLLSLDVSVLYLALPSLSADLHADATAQLWILDIYGFLVAGFLVAMGTLGDRLGRRRLLLIGAAGFALASILAAASTSPGMLIASRALLGVAGATLAPSTLALVRTLFDDPKQRALAIGIWFSSFLAGGALGPVIGGVLLEAFWWGSVFLLGVPVMLVLLVAGPRLLPEYRNPTAGRVDLPSVFLSLAAILPVVWGIKQLARSGPDSGILVAVAAGLVCLVLFLRRQRRLPDPLLDLRLFTSRSFSAALGLLLGGGIAIGGTFLFVSQYLQLVAGLSPLRAGLWLVPATVSMIVGTLAGPVILARLEPGARIATGLLVAAVGALLLLRVGADGDSGALILGFSVFFLGLGMPGGIGIELVIGSAPAEKAGSAAATAETTQELGLAVGLAVLGSLGTAVARGASSDLIGGLPDAVHAVAGVDAVLFLGLAALAGTVLRRRTHPSPQLAGSAPST
jgi:MFS transporter, DHA2 family, multidrug resistance protein